MFQKIIFHTIVLFAGVSLSKHFFVIKLGQNPQLIFDDGQEMTSDDGRVAEFKTKFYNLLAEKKGAKQGKNVVSLTKATYDEILLTLTSINTGSAKPSEKDRYEVFL